MASGEKITRKIVVNPKNMIEPLKCLWKLLTACAW
jgi:hypothetical protein